MISRELEAHILRLHHAEHWPIGTLARQLHVHHATVRRVLRQAGIAIVRERPRPSMIDPYVSFIQDTLTRYPTLRASRLYQMARERGYAGGPDHFRHQVSLYLSRGNQDDSCIGRDRAPRRICDCAPCPGTKAKSTGRTSVAWRSAAHCAR